MTPAYGVRSVQPDARVAPLRALVVDDESAIRSVVRRFLERRGWHVDEADDGDVAQGYLGESDLPRPRDYDMIIADVSMARVGGAELHRWMLAHRPDMVSAFVVASGNVCEQGTAAFLARARCPVLPKPFELPMLAELVVRLGGGTRRRSA